MTHERIFKPQYLEKSGPGSTYSYSAPYRAFLERFIQQYDITSILDLGCGDMEIMSHVARITRSDRPMHYHGVDCIPELIARNKEQYPGYSFSCADLRLYPVLAGGWTTKNTLVLVKDVIQHWSTTEICRWLFNFKPHMALVTNCNYGPTVNTDIETGGWRAIDLMRSPFSQFCSGEVVFQWGDDIGGYKDVVLIK